MKRMTIFNRQIAKNKRPGHYDRAFFVAGYPEWPAFQGDLRLDRALDGLATNVGGKLPAWSNLEEPHSVLFSATFFCSGTFWAEVSLRHVD